MIRFSEVVLAGHPDKFCDAVADAVLAACYEADPEAYCQVEVSAWSDQVWMSGGIVTRAPLTRSLQEIRRHSISRVMFQIEAGEAGPLCCSAKRPP